MDYIHRIIYNWSIERAHLMISLMVYTLEQQLWPTPLWYLFLKNLTLPFLEKKQGRGLLNNWIRVFLLDLFKTVLVFPRYQ